MTPPTSYCIGVHSSPPLVAESELRDHLRLLSAFRRLHHRVIEANKSGRGFFATDALPQYSAKEDGSGRSPAGAPTPPRLSPEHAWNVFLTRALHRFELYIAHIATYSRGHPPQEYEDLNLPCLVPPREKRQPVFCLEEAGLPPLDVALIWHSYLLNPTRYQEDAFRVPAHFPLQQVQFPLEALARLVGDDGNFDAPAEAIRHFERKTPWSFDGLAPPTTREPVLPSGELALPVRCVRPGCSGSAMIGWFAIGAVPAESTDKGAASTWSATCDSCDQLLSPNTLRGRQFLDDLRTWIADERSDRDGYRMRGGVLSERNASFHYKDPYAPVLSRLYANKRTTAEDNMSLQGERLAEGNDAYGAVLSGTGTIEADTAASSSDIEELSALILQNMTALARAMSLKSYHRKQVLQDLPVRIASLTQLYSTAHPLLRAASVDLVASVHRHYSFLKEIDSLGWIDAHKRAEADEPDWDSMLERYHSWLHVAALRPELFLTPTLDIDLVWHTHQLTGSRYYASCYRVLGRLLNHNSQIEVNRLARAFQSTAEIWSNTFHQPFSLCGCVEQRENWAKAKIGKLIGTLKGKGKGKEKRAAEQEENLKVFPLSEKERASHPSVHNRVYVPRMTQQPGADAEEQRQEKASTVGEDRGSEHINPFDPPTAAECQKMGPFSSAPRESPRSPGIGLGDDGLAPCIAAQPLEVRLINSDGTAHDRHLHSKGAQYAVEPIFGRGAPPAELASFAAGFSYIPATTGVGGFALEVQRATAYGVLM